MLNIAVIGCGAVSTGHLLAIKRSSQWNLGAVVDLSRDRAQAAANQFGPCPVFTNYQQALELPNLHAVIVATHVQTHHAITLAALHRGLHVLCEKPMADSPEKCRQMIDAAAKADRLLVINFNSRSSPHYRRIKELIDAGGLGRLRVVRIVYIWSCHNWQPQERMENFMRSGGPIMDSAVHFFDALRWFTNDEIADIQTQGVILPPWDAPQHAIATCRTQTGVLGLIEAGWLFSKNAKDRGSLYEITVIGDHGSVHWDDRTNRLDCFLKDQTLRETGTDSEKHFDIVHARFADSIHLGRLTDLAAGYDGLCATVASLKGLESAKSSHRVP